MNLFADYLKRGCSHHRAPASLLGLLALLVLSVSQPSQAQSFGTCNSRMFMDVANTPTSTLYSVTYASTPFTRTSLGPAASARNAIGYNPSDNYIYGISWLGMSGNSLVRVANDGSSTNLGVISNLPVANYNAGVISPAGDYYVMASTSGTTLYRVNIATRVATAITLSSSITVADFAWHNGFLWGISAGTLVRVNPSDGAVTTIGSSSPVNSALAMWGFSNGLFSGNGSRVYAIDPATAAATLMSTLSPGTSTGDGANCAGASIQFNADLSVTKTNTPAQGSNDLLTDGYVPGEVRTYSIVVSNTEAGSFGAQNVVVNDPLPAGVDAASASWTCTPTVGDAVCGAASGTGALNDVGLDLPPGSAATYLLTLTVPAGFTGNLTNTATITPPVTVNDSNAANNVATDVDIQSQADLYVTKTSAVATLMAGQTATYTVVAGNNGPSDASNSVVSDDWTTTPGLDCSAGPATCAASGTVGTQCPAPASVTPAALRTGLVIPALPNGGIVTFTLQCAVTATGLP